MGSLKRDSPGQFPLSRAFPGLCHLLRWSSRTISSTLVNRRLVHLGRKGIPHHHQLQPRSSIPQVVALPAILAECPLPQCGRNPQPLFRQQAPHPSTIPHRTHQGWGPPNPDKFNNKLIPISACFTEPDCFLAKCECGSEKFLKDCVYENRSMDGLWFLNKFNSCFLLSQRSKDNIIQY